MDRRRSPRYPLEERVELTCLSFDSEPGVATSRSARIVERSPAGLRIETAKPIAPSTLVRLDLADSLFLGEVVWCSKVGDHHHIGLKIEESLLHIQDLGRLMKSLLGNDCSRSLHKPEAVEAGRNRDHEGQSEGDQQEPSHSVCLAAPTKSVLNQIPHLPGALFRS